MAPPERIHNKLYQWVRVSEGRDATPSAVVLDSQSVETATIVAQAVGFDAGKRESKDASGICWLIHWG